MKIIVIIPAMDSASEVLLDELDRPLIVRTIEAAQKYFETIVATDSADIYTAIKKHSEDIQCYMVDHCNTETELARKVLQFINNISAYPTYDIVINWPTTESELNGQHLLDVLPQFTNNEIDVLTLAVPATIEQYHSPDVVKVVTDHNDFAMYFSRSPIPYAGEDTAYRHVGVYAFRYNILSLLGTLDDTAYLSERLEQLQWLETGIKIKVCVRHAL